MDNLQLVAMGHTLWSMNRRRPSQADLEVLARHELDLILETRAAEAVSGSPVAAPVAPREGLISRLRALLGGDRAPESVVAP